MKSANQQAWSEQEEHLVQSLLDAVCKIRRFKRIAKDNRWLLRPQRVMTVAETEFLQMHGWHGTSAEIDEYAGELVFAIALMAAFAEGEAEWFEAKAKELRRKLVNHWNIFLHPQLTLPLPPR